MCRRNGLSALWTPLILIALLGFAGLAVDWGYMRIAQSQLQGVADAGALAAVSAMPGNLAEARDRAIEAASRNIVARASHELRPNFENDPAGDIVFGTFNGTDFTETLAAPNAVKVVARRTEDSPNGPVPLFLARAIGVNVVPDKRAERDAIAIVRGTAIVLLKANGVGLQVAGGASLSVGGSVQVNAKGPRALTVTGSGAISALSFEIVGELFDSGNSVVQGAVHEGVEPVSDPLAHLPVPVLAQYPIRSNDKPLKPATGTVLQPGRYRGGIDIHSSVTMSPGVYIIEGGGLKVNSQATLIANEVFIYNTGTNDTLAQADELVINGGAKVTWTPPLTGPYAGITYFQNRNFSSRAVQINGDSSVLITGTIYAKSAEVQLSGKGGDRFGAGVVASSMQVVGQSNVSGPTSWGDCRVLLVE